MTPVTIYTDGAVRGNPGEGGWAALLEYKDRDGTIHRKEIYGQALEVTNNQMELQAIVEALATLKKPCHITLFTDSRTAMAWLRTYPPKDNVTANILAARYRQLMATGGHVLKAILIPGHAGIAGNERADVMAYCVARGLPIPEEEQK